MLSSTLLEILRTFSKDELKRFDDMVRSPYFNKKSSVTKLWNVLKKYSPEFDNNNLKRELVWKTLFGEKEFNYGVMKNLIYDLTQLSERFLEEEGFGENTYRRGLFLIEKLHSKKLIKLFNAKSNSTGEKLLSSKFDSYKYQDLADLVWQKYFLQDVPETNDLVSIYSASSYIIYNTLINLFKIYNNIMADKMLTNFGTDNKILELFLNYLDLDGLLNYIKKISFKDYLVVNLYFDMYKSLSNNGEAKYYFEFKKNIQKNDELVSFYERKNLYHCLWTALSFNKEIKNKLYEYHELNKISYIKKLHLDEESNVSVWDFSVAVRTAAMAKDYEFIEKFISENLDKIISEKRENMNIYGTAHYLFAKGDFTEALKLINKINIEIFRFRIELKYLQLMIFYELKDYEGLSYSFDSCRHFASKNKNMSETASKKMLRFINYMTKLCKMNENHDKLGIGMLREAVQEDDLTSKYWLLEKLDEIV